MQSYSGVDESVTTSAAAPDVDRTDTFSDSEEEVEDIFDDVLDYEACNGLMDPEEEVDEEPELLPDEVDIVAQYSSKVPPLPDGKVLSSSMVNFIQHVNKSYRLCFFQFLSFVDNAPGLGPDVLGYCTRENIDAFFREVIAKRTTSPAVNRRYVSAIQQYCAFWEERAGFTVDSPMVKKALADAKICKKKFHARTNQHVDAHKHRPTRHPSPSQELSMIDLAFNDVRPSKYGYLPIGINFLISWNCAMQALTRGDEVRSTRIPDLCHETNYGPWRLTSDSGFMIDNGTTNSSDDSTPDGILSIIQQPFSTKLNSPKAHAVGFFRHRDWRRCATSVIAFSIMARFQYMNHSELSTFFSINEDSVPNWYNYFLIDWRSYKHMADAFKEYFAAANIDYSKLTHARKLGIIRAHQLGADRENIILLSKHTVHKVDTSYLPELPYNAMLACAGFDVFRRQQYYIPRSYAQVPQEWHSRIFPYLNQWQMQVNGLRAYDKGKSAKTFVNFVLPHLAQIIIQDGIYFTEMYPHHPYVAILQQKLAGVGYTEWCIKVKETIDSRMLHMEQSIREDRHYDAILRTSEHTAHRVLSVEQRMDCLTSEVKHLSHMILQQMQNNSPPLHRTMGHIGQMSSTPISSGGHSHTTPNSVGSTTTALHASSFRYEAMAYSPTRRDRQAIWVQHTREEEQHWVQHTTAQEQHCCSIVPIIPPNIHRTIFENIEYWLNHKYWEFLRRGDASLRQLGWDTKTQHRFCKRRDIALWVKVAAEEKMNSELHWDKDGDILLQVASDMDGERGKKTVLVALNEFKQTSHLSWKKSRKKK